MNGRMSKKLRRYSDKNELATVLEMKKFANSQNLFVRIKIALMIVWGSW